jgi:hypothetical protein
MSKLRTLLAFVGGFLQELKDQGAAYLQKMGQAHEPAWITGDKESEGPPVL